MTAASRWPAGAGRAPPPARRLAPVLAAACMVALGGCGGRSHELESTDPGRRATAVRALDPAEARTLPALLVAQADRSPLVRIAAVEAFNRLGGARAAEGLGALLLDPEPSVALAAASALASLPPAAGGRERLLAAYAGATTPARAAIAAALDRTGVGLRDAVEAEARALWERNLVALERGPPVARAGAAEELGASGRAEAVARLQALLDGPARADRRLAAAAARGLGLSGDRAARSRLELLLEAPDRDLAAGAADGLRRLGDPAAADALAAAAEGAGPAAWAALRALEALPKAPEVGAALCAVAVRSGEPGRASTAARLASQRDHTCPVRPLLARLGRPGEVAALAALADLRLPPAEAEAAARRVAAYLAAGQGSGEARAAAATALGRLGFTGAGPALAARALILVKLLADGRARLSSGVPSGASVAGVAGRASAALPLAAGTSGGPPPALPDTPAALELGATLAAAARLGAAAIDPLLEPALRDPSPAVRAGAVEALAWLHRGAAVDPVARALADRDAGVRRAAVRSLGALGPPALEPLVRAAGASRPEDAAWRVELAGALGEAGSAEAVGGLAALLEGESTGPAAEALARLGASSGAAPIARLVARPGAPALPALLDALSQLGGVESGPAIMAHLTSDSAEVRESAVRALGRIRYEPAAARLEALRSDYSGAVRRGAVEALAKLPIRRPPPRP